MILSRLSDQDSGSLILGQSAKIDKDTFGLFEVYCEQWTDIYLLFY